MSIRKGAMDIENRNKQIETRRSQSYIPELRLYNDGEIAVFRILSDEPLDVDFHEIMDKSISGRPIYTFCKRGDNEPCDMCDNQVGTMARLFMFWTYVIRILHPNQNKDGTWEAVTSGTKTMYQENVNSVRLFKSKFGKGQYLWKDFYEFYEENATWKDREFAFKRRGASGDRNTTYKLSGLDKSPIPNEISDLMGKLPPLEAVAKNLVTKLDLDKILGVEKTEEKKEDRPVEKVDLKSKDKKKKEDKPKKMVDLDSKLEEGKEESGDVED